MATVLTIAKTYWAHVLALFSFSGIVVFVWKHRESIWKKILFFRSLETRVEALELGNETSMYCEVNYKTHERHEKTKMDVFHTAVDSQSRINRYWFRCPICGWEAKKDFPSERLTKGCQAVEGMPMDRNGVASVSHQDRFKWPRDTSRTLKLTRAGQNSAAVIRIEVERESVRGAVSLTHIADRL